MANLKHTLKEHNVTLTDEKRLLLKCNKCGAIWSPNTQPEERLLRGYWHCPKHCNYTEKDYKHPADVRAYFAQRNRKQNKRA